MTTILTPALIDRCHAGSRAKGFWEEVPPQGQQLMLVISELAEALEAHRKGYRADKALYAESLERVEFLTPDKHKEEAWARAFVACYKDTVEDELADAYIRLCDFAGGYGLKIKYVLEHYNIERGDFDKCPENFGEALLGLTMLTCSIHEDGNKAENVGIALAAIEYVAEHFKIDLATHIDLKLRYNATRPAKHGKAY